jgi:hypothetical protein
MNLKEIEWEILDWIRLPQDRDQWRVLGITVVNVRVPSRAVNFLTSWATTSFPWRTLFRGARNHTFGTELGNALYPVIPDFWYYCGYMWELITLKCYFLCCTFQCGNSVLGISNKRASFTVLIWPVIWRCLEVEENVLFRRFTAEGRLLW